jgi:hypothetical protein
MVDNTKIEIETQRRKEEVKAINEYKRAVVQLNEEEEEKRLQEFKNDIFSNKKSDNKRSIISNEFKTVRKSQSELLANVVKKRSISESNENKSEKHLKVENSNINEVLQNEASIKDSSLNTDTCLETNDKLVKCIGVLPGVGYYASSDSSDSENSSNSENELNDDLMSGFKLIVRRKRVNTQEIKIETHSHE